MPVTAFNGNGLVSKLEILRGDLVDMLYQATGDQTEYRFNTRIADLNQNEDAVQATLSDGTNLSADLVIGCDGPHSVVRRLVFGPEEQFVKPLGGYKASLTAPDTVGLDGWHLMYQAPGLNVSMRPSHDPTMCKAGLAFRSDPVGYDRRNSDEQRALLTRHFASARWQCDALVAAAATAEDFYFDTFAHVHMPTFSQGRVTLAGDAGYCALPLSSTGTSLALVGAYVLAGELGHADSLDANKVQAALRRYEAVMRPYIDRCQDLPNGIDGYLPESASDIAITAAVMKWMQRWPFVRSPSESRSPSPTPSSCRTTDRALHSVFGPPPR
jgi:2-polyprenyl-6-methoxyphenol hydroxylase-like FAD-dependent oxidoreductase